MHKPEEKKEKEMICIFPEANSNTKEKIDTVVFASKQKLVIQLVKLPLNRTQDPKAISLVESDEYYYVTVKDLYGNFIRQDSILTQSFFKGEDQLGKKVYKIQYLKMIALSDKITLEFELLPVSGGSGIIGKYALLLESMEIEYSFEKI